MLQGYLERSGSRFFFGGGRPPKINCFRTLQEIKAEVIARACWMKFELGWSKERVFTGRLILYAPLMGLGIDEAWVNISSQLALNNFHRFSRLEKAK